MNATLSRCEQIAVIERVESYGSAVAGLLGTLAALLLIAATLFVCSRPNESPAARS